MTDTVQKGRGRRGNLVSDLVDALRAEIGRETYRKGDRLPSEADLTAKHGVSRTVVREAIAALRADGLVESRQGSGVYVLDSSPVMDAPFKDIDFNRVSSVVELLELRIALESEAAALAAMRRSPAQEEKLLACLDAFLEAQESGRGSSEADFELHLAIAAASNNKRFVEILSLIGPSVIPRRALSDGGRSGADREYLAMLDTEHRAIVNAIVDGDAEGARQAMRSHLTSSLTRYRNLLRRRDA